MVSCCGLVPRGRHSTHRKKPAGIHRTAARVCFFRGSLTVVGVVLRACGLLHKTALCMTHECTQSYASRTMALATITTRAHLKRRSGDHENVPACGSLGSTNAAAAS
jgi:hypothetical protein